MKRWLIPVANAAGVFLALLVFWQAIIWIFHVAPYMLPPPFAVAKAVFSRGPLLLNAFTITAEEAAGGLAASVVVGIAMALFFAQWHWMRRLLYPYTLLLQTVPIIAIAPLILMWVGAGK